MGLFAGTEFDRPPRCERCDQLETECECLPEPPLRIPPEDQTARITMEKRKRGKLMTVVKGLPLIGNDLPALLTQLKSSCGAGGTLNDAGQLHEKGLIFQRGYLPAGRYSSLP